MRVLLDALRLAVATIARNRMRALLTVLGILIGITAVVVVTATVQSTSAAVDDRIDSMASNAIYVWPRPVQVSGARSKFVGRLTDNDGDAIRREAVSVSAVAPFLISQAQVVYADKNVNTWVVGTTLPYFAIRRFEIAKGERWTETDEIAKSKTCVLGKTVATSLFGTEDPIGRTIRIGRAPFRVVGLLTTRGSGTFGEDQDDRIMMPASTYRARVVHMPPGRADELMFSATSAETVDRARAQIENILRQRHHLEEGRDDFEVRTQAEMRETADSIARTLALLGIGVAGVSLLVGGVGVMNIMLVSVSERTREIGIRMAVGARERDILLQFLVESVTLTLLGGVLGILVGSAAAMGIGRALDMPMAPSGTAVFVAVGTSLTIGLAFGLLPAVRAARLDPIAALHTE
jgi:putative ABC transport system permease protein